MFFNEKYFDNKYIVNVLSNINTIELDELPENISCLMNFGNEHTTPTDLTIPPSPNLGKKNKYNDDIIKWLFDELKESSPSLVNNNMFMSFNNMIKKNI
jgi:hypothetical protein